jgi:hypothetical protein
MLSIGTTIKVIQIKIKLYGGFKMYRNIMLNEIKEYNKLILRLKKSIEVERNLINWNDEKQVKHFEKYKNSKLESIKNYEEIINLNQSFILQEIGYK